MMIAKAESTKSGIIRPKIKEKLILVYWIVKPIEQKQAAMKLFAHG